MVSLRFKEFFILTLLCFIPAVAIAQNSFIPEFAIVTSNDVFRAYKKETVSDDIVDASVLSLGNNQWRLNIKAKKAIKKVYFPWQNERTPIAEKIDNDFYFLPFILGVVEKASLRNADWAWGSANVYPGTYFAPLTVMANTEKAKIVAALNWPAKRVVPLAAAQRQVMLYDEVISIGATSSFGALVAVVEGNSEKGILPWQKALDLYKEWVNAKVGSIYYPEWLELSHGWINIQLENHMTIDMKKFKATWETWKDSLSWVQVWGQMSAYGGGCCSLSLDPHPRLLSEFLPWVQEERAKNSKSRFGFYSAPYYGDSNGPALMLDTQSGYDWLMTWLGRNFLTLTANSFYIDTLGRGYYGNPEKVRSMMEQGIIPYGTVIEGIVDIYPSAGLVSGALNGGDWKGGPDATPEKQGYTTYPRFGRYLLGDRIMFMGESNGDFAFWGEKNNHWNERQVFLMGLKFDAMTPSNNLTGAPNSALKEVIQLRDEVKWWERKPVYIDTQGITEIPAGIEIRRFKDKDNKDLIVIENWQEKEGLYFKIDSLLVAIPKRRLSILDSITTCDERLLEEKKMEIVRSLALVDSTSTTLMLGLQKDWLSPINNSKPSKSAAMKKKKKRYDQNYLKLIENFTDLKAELSTIPAFFLSCPDPVMDNAEEFNLAKQNSATKLADYDSNLQKAYKQLIDKKLARKKKKRLDQKKSFAMKEIQTLKAQIDNLTS